MKTMPDNLETELARGSLIYWINSWGIKNEKGQPIDFKRYYFLKALYTDKSKKIAIQKPSQVGVSTWAVLLCLHRIIYWGVNLIHTQPTSGDASKFVESKVNKIIQLNPSIGQRMSKDSADSLKMKSIGKGFIFYQATFAVGQSFMITSDINIYDELDRSNPETIDNYRSRQEGEASLRQEYFISTPELPNSGINKVFADSDQKHLRFNCPHKKCGHRQHFSWPESVDFEREEYVCKQCNGVIDNTQFPDKQKEWDIRWEARYDDREISGYWINQMIIPWKTCADLIKDYKEADRKGKLKYFFNHQIGVPYQDATASLNEAVFIQNIRTKAVKEKPSYMGVDVQGNALYAIIGSLEGVYGIIEILGGTSDQRWDRLAQLMDVYDVKVAVIDAGYKPNEVRAFCDRYPYRAYTCWFKEDPKGIKISRWGDEKFDSKGTREERTTVLVDRERAIDRAVHKLVKSDLPFLNYTPNEVSFEMLTDHSKVMYKQTITNNLGEPREVWEKTGQNDLFMALVYFTVALEKA